MAALRFLLFYLAWAAAGSTASFVFGGDVPSVGASGAIFGLFGILLAAGRIHHPVDRESRGILNQLVFLIVVNIAFGFASGGSIDNAAHLGGLAAGLWLGALVPPTGVPTLSTLWRRPVEAGVGAGPTTAPGYLVVVGPGPRGHRRRRRSGDRDRSEPTRERPTSRPIGPALPGRRGLAAPVDRVAAHRPATRSPTDVRHAPGRLAPPAARTRRPGRGPGRGRGPGPGGGRPRARDRRRPVRRGPAARRLARDVPAHGPGGQAGRPRAVHARTGRWRSAPGSAGATLAAAVRPQRHPARARPPPAARSSRSTNRPPPRSATTRPSEALFREAHARLTDGLTGTHLSLAITGGNADAAGIETLLAAPYASLAVDLIAGPDNWRLVVAATPGDRGIVCGALGTRAGTDDGPELLLWAAAYAASTGGRGLERVGIATASSLAALPWAVAVRKMERLGEAARLAGQPGEERARHLDPRAVSIRSAALGRVDRPPPRASTGPDDPT